MKTKTGTRSRGLTVAELRDRGVPEDVIAYWRSDVRVWTGPLEDVRVNGQPCRPEESVADWVRRNMPPRLDG